MRCNSTAGSVVIQAVLLKLNLATGKQGTAFKTCTTSKATRYLKIYDREGT